MKTTIPTVFDYANFLSIVCERFNITLNEARRRYGLYTYEQWNKLLEI